MAETPASTVAAKPSYAPVSVTPRLEYALTVDLTTGMLRVRASLWSKPATVVWLLPFDPAITVKVKGAFDGPTPARVQTTNAGAMLKYEVAGTQAPVVLELEASARIGEFDDLAGVGIAPDRIRASMQSVLPVPSGLGPERLPTTLVVNGPQKDWTSFVSSIDLAGDRAELPAGLVRKIGVLGGKLGLADFEVGGQRDRLAWLGPLGFDPRPVGGDLAFIRSTLAEYFRVSAAKPFTLLLSATMIRSGEFRIETVTGGLMVDMNAGGRWSDLLRLGVTKALVNDFMATLLRLRPRDEQRRIETAWFEHGVARYLAREVLFSVGALNPLEYTAELNRLAATLASSGHRGTPNQELPETSSALALAEARGALHAAWLDSQMLRQSKGAQGLRAALTALTARARSAQGELSIEAWAEETSKLLGPPARTAFEAQVIKGRQTQLLADTFGPCFLPAKRRFESLRLDFEMGQAPDGRRLVQVVKPESPAAVAGLRVGDEILLLTSRPSEKKEPVELTLRRAKEQAQLKFMPLTASNEGQGWKVRANVDEADCQSRAGR